MRKTPPAAPSGSARALRQPAEPRHAEPEPYTSISERPGFLVRRLHQIHVAMFLEAMSEENITPIQYGLLSILANRPGLDQLSVARELGIDRVNVGDVLKRLEQRKLLTRVVDPNDKRRNICLLTRDGTDFVHKYHEKMQQVQERLLKPLGAEERKTFMTLLRRLVGENNDIGRAPLKPLKGGFTD